MSQRRRTGPPGRMRPAPHVRPAHAGRLARWERLTFAAAFVLMAAFIVIVTITSARLRGSGAGGAPAAPPAVGGAGPGGVPAPAGQHATAVPVPGSRGDGRRSWDRRLAEALAPVLRAHSGHLAVGVINRSSGAMAVYGGDRQIAAAGLARVSILASLLLRHQPPDAGLSAADRRLAVSMMEAGDDTAATVLWNRAGAAAGLAAADSRLGLAHTAPGPGELWSQTSTTVEDQLTLLRDLTTAGSPLTPSARGYALSLMSAASAARRRDALGAADPSYAVASGSLPGRSAGNWTVNSIGVLRRDHQRLLLAVLASGQPTEAAGIAADRAAAAAAAACITAATPG